MAFDLDDVKVVRPVNKPRPMPPPPGGTDDLSTWPAFQEAVANGKIPNLVGLPKVVVAAFLGQPNPKPKKITAEKWATVVEAFRTKTDTDLISSVLCSGLSKGQKAAFEAVRDFAGSRDPHRFFSLKGYAGTGKSFTLRRVTLYLDLIGSPWLLTAPTNKAVKVLQGFVPGISKDKCKTIYSTLKLTMTADEDQQVLVDMAHDGYDSLGILSGTLLVVDEASMLNIQVVTKVKAVATDLGLRVLFTGDPDQLRPVGEEKSTAWELCEVPDSLFVKADTKPIRTVFLTEVRRFESALLELSVQLRAALRVAENEGTYPNTKKLFPAVENEIRPCKTTEIFDAEILKLKSPNDFRDTKVICWRNKSVDRYNTLIRNNLGFTDEYNVGDLLMLAQPKLQKVNYRRSIIIASVDEEVEVLAVRQRVHKPVSQYFPNLPQIDYWELDTQTIDYADNKPLKPTINMPLAEDHGLEDALQQMAAGAKRAGEMAYKDKQNYRKHSEERKQRWREYWELREVFTLVRFGYAITAHRAQGSSYANTYLDSRDIVCNPEVVEGTQCLLVGGTRARTSLTVLV